MLRKSGFTLRFALVACLCTALSGCFPLIIGAGVGIVGGYAISRDTFEGVTAKGSEELWDAANKVASIMGYIENSDKRANQFTARINGAKVTITILPISMTTTKLRIKARRNMLPAIEVAQEAYSKIMNQLEQ